MYKLWWFLTTKQSKSGNWQWCGLRPPVLGKDQPETQKHSLGLACRGLGLAGLVLCCETRSCYARRHNADSNFSSTIYSFFLFCAWNITTVEINSGVHLLKSWIRQVPLFTSGGLGLGLVSSGLGLVILVLVFRIWSCLHHYSWRFG